MKVKTSELIGQALDWAVAKIESGIEPEYFNGSVWITTGGFFARVRRNVFEPSTNWSQGGPIIERERIQVFPHNGASEWCGVIHVPRDGYTGILTQDGPTPLIAAMRAFVTKKFGDEIEIPEELK